MRKIIFLVAFVASVSLTSQTVLARPTSPSASPVPTSVGADLDTVASLVRRIEIPCRTFTLANGLRVVVHEDRTTPVVAVGVWYNVGSKDEPAGRTGFAIYSST